jgi:hypothetical protein
MSIIMTLSKSIVNMILFKISHPCAAATEPCPVVGVAWHQASGHWSLLELEPEASSER